jgi:hypothetical protein
VGWWKHHHNTWVTANNLADEVKSIADPYGKGRQFLATFIGKLTGTHAAGFVLGSQESSGKWSPIQYHLQPADAGNPIGHRVIGDHRSPEAAANPMTPMTPMPDAPDRNAVPAGREVKV